MAHSRASFVDLDDNSPPTCNFDPINIVSSLFSSSPMAVPSSFKVPSPQARSLNASQPSIDKGKARMKSPEIIELSDSDIEDPKPKGKAPAQRLSAGRASTSNASGSQAHGACIQLTATPSPIDAPGSSQDIFQYLKLVTNEPTVQEIPVLVPVDEPHPAEPSNASVDPLDRLIASVIEIIPDVDPDHVAARYTLYREGAQEQGQEEDPSRYLQAILHDLFENPEYPRVSKKRKRHDDENDSTAGASNPKKRKKENVVKMDITSLDRPEILSDTYIDLSLYWLGVKFPLLRKRYLKEVFQENRKLFAPTFVYLKTLIESDGVRELFKKTSATRRLANGPPWNDVDFDRELQWAMNWFPGKSGVIEYVVQETGDSNAAFEAQEEKIESEECEPGSGIDCGCCFSEYVADTMIQCPDGHLFCKSCIYMFCQERLGQRNAKIKCMDQTNCELEISHDQLKLCLPQKLLGLYERIKQDEEIAAAGLENLEECPFCDYKCVIENDMERLFHCLNEDCGTTSCRQCKKKDHLPKTCAEAVEDNTLNAQHSVEEAMTNALMRKCPHCQAAFVKTDGCNKITCTQCRKLSCYICRKPVTGYDHFNGQPARHASRKGSNSNKCPLWDGNGGVEGANGLEVRHHEEVASAREKALAAMREINLDVDLDQVRVDAPDAPRVAPRAAPPPARPQPFPRPRHVPPPPPPPPPRQALPPPPAPRQMLEAIPTMHPGWTQQPYVPPAAHLPLDYFPYQPPQVLPAQHAQPMFHHIVDMAHRPAHYQAYAPAPAPHVPPCQCRTCLPREWF